MRKNVILILLAVIVLGTGSAYGEKDFADVYGKANKAVVLIESEDGAREGSGVIVGTTPSGTALILTAHHVVNGYGKVIVSFSGVIETYDGTVSVKFFDDTQDLAIVSVDDPPPDLETINFRKSAGKKGESIGTIGHPLGEAFTWSSGSITNLHGKYITHDAKLERGSSGGPLLDGCARMLGMNVHLIELPDEITGIDQDTLDVGGVALASNSIISIMDGWFSDTRFDKKWGVKKYCSFWQRLYKDPLFLIPEIGAAVYGIIALVTGDDVKEGEEKTFGTPPLPPGGQ